MISKIEKHYRMDNTKETKIERRSRKVETNIAK
jgi:hypothetical protein